MATKRQEAVEEEPEEDLEPEEEPEQQEAPEQQSAAPIDTVPWRQMMEDAGLIENIDPALHPEHAEQSEQFEQSV